MATDPSSSHGPEPPFNLDDALKRVDGDRALLAEIAGIFVADAPAMLADVMSAVTAGDADAVSRAAHRLKGSILTFGADAAAAAALALEKSGRSGDLTTAEAEVQRLAVEIDRLRERLESLVREQPRPSA